MFYNYYGFLFSLAIHMCSSSLGLPSIREVELVEKVQQRATKMSKVLEHLSYEERLRELALLGLLRPEKTSFKGISSICTHT